MTPRERLMAALVESGVSYEQRPEHDVAAVLAADPTLERAIELGLAWREAEEALPEGYFPSVDPSYVEDPEPWMAVGATRNDGGMTHILDHWGHGPTPAAALRNLAERLREVQR